MKQRLITTDEIEVGDEIIISCFRELKYLKVVQIPRKKDSTRFKCSIRQLQRSAGGWIYIVNSFEQDVTQHNHIMYQDLYERHIFLVKRENND